MKITFFAHATTYDNEAAIATGQADAKISPLGKTQIDNLKNLVKDKNFDIVYCSDLSRAVETAEGAFGGRIEIQIDERLRELDLGDFTRKTDEYVDSKTVTEAHIRDPFPNGESLKDVETRMSSFISHITHSGYNDIAIVAHRFNNLSLDVILKGKTWEEALAEDWRKTKSWQPGWEYIIN